MHLLANPKRVAFSQSQGNRDKTARHHWWPVAYSSELARDGGTPLSVTLFGEPLALFRNGEDVACVADVCPHKSAALSTGTVQNGQLVCRYHGWRFSGSGACAHPEQVANKSRTSLYSYPAIDDGLLIWVFPSQDECVEFRNPVLEHASRAGIELGPYLPRKFEFDQPWELWAASFVDGTHHEHAHPKTFMKEQRGTLSFHFDEELSPGAMVVRGEHDRSLGVLAYLTFSPVEENKHKQFLTLFPTSRLLPKSVAYGLFRALRIGELLYEVVYEDYYLVVKQLERIQQGASKWGMRGNFGFPTSDRFIDWHRSHAKESLWFDAYDEKGNPVFSPAAQAPAPRPVRVPIFEDSGLDLGPPSVRAQRPSFEEAEPKTWRELPLYDRVVKRLAETAIRFAQ